MSGHPGTGGVVRLVVGEAGVHAPVGASVVQRIVVYPRHAELRAGHARADLGECGGVVGQRKGATHALGRSGVKTSTLLLTSSRRVELLMATR